MELKSRNIKIDERVFVELYNAGRDDFDLAKFFNCGTRTIQNMCQKLRKSGKIQARKILTSEKLIRSKVEPKNDLSSLDLTVLNDENFELLKKEAKLKWKVPTSKIPANKKKDFKTYVIVGDIHVPEQDDLALNAVFNLMRQEKFDGIINIGDYMDFSSISRFSKGKNKTLEGQRLKNDYIKGNAILDVFDELLPKNAEKHFLTGNHEVRVNALIEEYPMLEGLFDFETCLRLKERGYKTYAHNDIVKFGRLNVVHGIYCGANPAKSHATKLLSNVLTGHLHSPEMALIHSPAKEVSVVGYVNGCLCSMSPEYMAGKPSNWSQGIAILYVFPDGQFDVNLIRIVKHKFVYNNNVYDGNIK
jgi:predicted phosphodiesterase